jgi:hypothetical protein
VRDRLSARAVNKSSPLKFGDAIVNALLVATLRQCSGNLVFVRKSSIRFGFEYRDGMARSQLLMMPTRLHLDPSNGRITVRHHPGLMRLVYLVADIVQCGKLHKWHKIL